jgi:hypothetical protein
LVSEEHRLEAYATLGVRSQESEFRIQFQNSEFRSQNRTGPGRGLGIFTGAGSWLLPPDS